MPTRVAETSWQISTSSRIGLRKLAGFSTSLASWRAPRRLSSTSDLALILLIRTRLVSAMASTPEPASSTAMTTMRMASSASKPDVAKQRGHRRRSRPLADPVEAVEQLLLERLHPLGLGVLLVVHAEQVQQPVHDQQRDLVVERHLVLLGVARRHRRGR